jgi:DNA-binding beta-propeller fold protein YncE
MRGFARSPLAQEIKMIANRWILGVSVVAGMGFCSPLNAQIKGDQDITGPYEVVEDWLKPMPWHQDGWTFGLVAAVYPDTPNRIFLLQGGDLPDPRPTERAGPRSNALHTPSHFVLVLNGDGELIESWTQWDHLFVRPHKVTINPYDPERHVWIVDDWASQIFKFTNDGSELVMTLGEREVMGDDEDHFGRPTDMAFLPDGTFFVSDGYVNARVVKFNEDGEYLMQWGSAGTGPGQFNLVHSVKVDADRRVYVADRRNGRIQIFDENGKFLDMWDGMAQPSHIVVAQDQTVWMSDPTLNRLVQFSLNGLLLTYWGAAGSFAGAFNNPHHFDVDQDGNLYVADYANFRVQKFVPSPNGDRRRLIQPAFASVRSTGGR